MTYRKWRLHSLSVLKPLCGQAVHSLNNTACYKKHGGEEKRLRNDRVENAELNSQPALLCVFLLSFKHMKHLQQES